MKIAFNVMIYLIELIFSVAILFFAYNLISDISVKFYEYGRTMSQENGDKEYKEVSVTIGEDATAQDIAEILYDNGLVPNSMLFTLQTRLNGTEDLFYNGTYQLNTHMETSDIIDLLTTAPMIYADFGISITIKEGYTQKQIGEYLESKGIVTAEEFHEACRADIYNYSFLEGLPDREYKLEGYLFPETYYIAEDATAEEIVNRLLSQFHSVYVDEYAARAEDLGLTTDDVIRIASIIEKEIQIDSERSKASAVIYNRLDKRMELQMCSTILYALGKRKDRLLDEDLKVKSPYNTYINNGLPVGPIANPGEACIKAALYPDDVDYLYFVLKGDDSTEHVFTNNYNEFLEAKALYNQKF